MKPTELDRKLNVAILGATGAVGQRYVSLLHNHPWFNVKHIMASSRSVGKKYGEHCSWSLDSEIPSTIASLTIEDCKPLLNIDLAFSGLASSVAGEIETEFADFGIPVVSNSRNHRMDPCVPLIIPEVNSSHLKLIEKQKLKKNRSGFIVTNPNCSTIILNLAVAPLHKAFNIQKMFVSTIQAVSGAGYPGMSFLDIQDNVIPYIPGEEPKIINETNKIFGELKSDSVKEASIAISAFCHRAMVSDGHMISVSLSFEAAPTIQDILETWKSFSPEPIALRCPSQPARPIVYNPDKMRPQVRKDRNCQKGMAVTIGRLRQCNILDFQFTILGHNTVRGAAGGAILVGERLLADGFLLAN